MEEYSAHVIQVAIQCEKTPASLVVPDLNLVVVTSRHKQGLGRMKVDTADGAIVLFESVNESSHAVVPQLDGR